METQCNDSRCKGIQNIGIAVFTNVSDDCSPVVFAEHRQQGETEVLFKNQKKAQAPKEKKSETNDK